MDLFFKTGEVLEEFTADGLEEAKEKLDKMKLSSEERKKYEEYVERLRKIASTQLTQIEDVKDLIKKKIDEGVREKVDETKRKAVLELDRLGLEKGKITIALDISIEKVNQILRENG